MSLKKHFYRAEPFQICTEIYTYNNNTTRCIFLCYHNNGMYSCNALGFRFKNANINGTCHRKGIKVLYDEELFFHEKKKHINVCLFRLVGIVIIIMPFMVSTLARIVLNKFR